MGGSSSQPKPFRKFCDPSKSPNDYVLRFFKSREEFQNFYKLPKDSPERNKIRKLEKERKNAFSKYNDDRVEWIQNQTKNLLKTNQNLRDNLKILIIIGSKLNYNDDKRFIENNEDFVTALLLYHLFHYAFGISESNILLTSSNDKNFFNDPNPNAHVSPTSSPSKHLEEGANQTLLEDLYIGNVKFTFFNTVFAQVGTKQYHFLPDIKLNSKLEPFNRYFLNFLHTTNESILYVFFLDHGFPGFFNLLNYQHFVQRLTEIKYKQVIIFNQSCNSGSLIDLIKISEDIKTISKSMNNPQLEKLSLKEIFDKLSSIARNKNSITDIEQEIANGDKEDIEKGQKDINSLNQEIKKINTSIQEEYNNLYQYFTNKEEEVQIKSIIERIIEHLKEYRYLHSIDPKLFLQFKKNAAIFCSCPYNMKCSSLPYRYFYVGSKLVIGAHGGVYSSAVIQTLLNINQTDIHIPDFVEHLQHEFDVISSSLRDYIIAQNTFSEDDCPARDSETKKKLEDRCDEILTILNQHLSYKFQNNETYYISPSIQELPDLHSILLHKYYWNVDIEEVNVEDYKDIKIYNYHNMIREDSNEEQNIKEKKDKYGPVSGEYIILTFMNDFTKCLEELLAKHKMNTKLKYGMKLTEFSEETEKLYRKFYICAIQKTNFNTYHAIYNLESIIKNNMEIVFKDNKEKFGSLCYLSCCTILPYWEDVSFNFFP